MLLALTPTQSRGGRGRQGTDGGDEGGGVSEPVVVERKALVLGPREKVPNDGQARAGARACGRRRRRGRRHGEGDGEVGEGLRRDGGGGGEGRERGEEVVHGPPPGIHKTQPLFWFVEGS